MTTFFNDQKSDKAMLLVTPMSANPVLDQATQDFLDRLPSSADEQLTYGHRLTEQQSRFEFAPPLSESPVSAQDVTLQTGPTGTVHVRIFRPRHAPSELPLLFYFHGGGWVSGNLHTHDRLLRDISAGAGIAVAAIEYSHAPEQQFPTQLEEGYAAMVGLLEHAASFGIDETRIAVGGDGAGGNMAAVMCLLAKQRNGPNIRLQLLFCPIMSGNFDTASYRTFEHGPWLTKAIVSSFFSNYGVADLPTNIQAFPLSATIRQLEGLPQAVIITAENDILCDEGEHYAKKLMQSGVVVAATRYIGTIHDFVVLDALSETPAAKAAMEHANAALKGALLA